MKKIEMLVVDDHQLVLDGLKHLLAYGYDLSSIEFVTSVERALRLIPSMPKLELLLTDIFLPGLNGFDLLQGVSDKGLVIPSIILSSSEDAEDVKRAIDLGASGFISKSAGSDEIIQAIEAVMDGQMYLSADVLGVLKVTSAVPQEELESSQESEGLSVRQIDALKLIEQGFTNKQIASILELSESTVKYHIKALFRRLDANTRTGCVRSARERGYL